MDNTSTKSNLTCPLCHSEVTKDNFKRLSLENIIKTLTTIINMTSTQYRDTHREQIRAYDREYIQRPEVKAKRKAYALANKDKTNKQRRENYAKTHKSL